MLESTDKWAAIETAVQARAIKDVAAEFGVSPGAITAALLRTRTTRDPVQGAGAPPPPTRPKRAESAATSVVNGLECRAGTKDADIAALKDRLGTDSDAVIAQQVGVSVRTVAAFRRRHGITGRKGRGAAKPPAAEGLPPEKAASKRKPRKAKAVKKTDGRRRKRSKIDAFVDQVGTRPDREIAELAGVSTNAVVAYRRRRGIQSARAAAASAATSAAGAAAPPDKAPSSRPASSANKGTRTPGGKVYRVDLSAGGSAFVIASSLVDAAQQVQSRKGVVGVALAGDLLS